MLLPILTARQGIRPPIAGKHRGEPFPKMPDSDEIIMASSIVPQGCGCQAGGSGQGNGYVYAIGEIEPLFPSLSVEKEFYQALDPSDAGKPVTKDLLYKVFTKLESISPPDTKDPEMVEVNWYLAQQMVWVFKIGGLEAYILKPDSNETLTLFVNSLSSAASDVTPQLIVGVALPVSGEMPEGDTYLPLVLCNNSFPFDTQAFIQAIQDAATQLKITPPTNDEINALLSGVTKELIRNPGAGNPDRALNFSLTQCPDVYLSLWQMANGGTTSGPKDTAGFSLIDAEAVPSSVQGGNLAYDVVFSFRGNSTNVPVRLYCRIDVKGQFPFQISGMARYFG